MIITCRAYDKGLIQNRNLPSFGSKISAFLKLSTAASMSWSAMFA